MVVGAVAGELGAGVVPVDMVGERVGQRVAGGLARRVADEHRDKLTTRTEQQVDEPGAGSAGVTGDHHHLVTGDAEAVPGEQGPAQVSAISPAIRTEPCRDPAAARAMV